MNHSEPVSSQIGRIRRALSNDRPAIRRDLAGEGGEAAVLVPLFERDGELNALFIRRSDDVASHRGQVAFPGGHAEPEDGDLLTAALREAQEEVGIEPGNVEILGRFPSLNTLTSGILVTPVVGLVHEGALAAVRPDPHEVAEIFTVPLSILRAPGFRGNYSWRRDGRSTDYPAILYANQIIWGLTFRITLNLLDILDSDSPQR